MRYIVTGVTVRGKRFRLVYTNAMIAMCINLWRGSVWEQPDGGKRRLLKRVWN